MSLTTLHIVTRLISPNPVSLDRSSVFFAVGLVPIEEGYSRYVIQPPVLQDTLTEATWCPGPTDVDDGFERFSEYIDPGGIRGLLDIGFIPSQNGRFADYHGLTVSLQNRRSPTEDARSAGLPRSIPSLTFGSELQSSRGPNYCQVLPVPMVSTASSNDWPRRPM